MARWYNPNGSRTTVVTDGTPDTDPTLRGWVNLDDPSAWTQVVPTLPAHEQFYLLGEQLIILARNPSTRPADLLPIITALRAAAAANNAIAGNAQLDPREFEAGAVSALGWESPRHEAVAAALQAAGVNPLASPDWRPRAGNSANPFPGTGPTDNSGSGNAGTTSGTGNGSGIPPSAAKQALINYIQANMGAAYGDANYNPSFDLNNDGVINGLDYSLALSGVTVPSGGPYGNGPVSGGGSGNNGTPPPPSPPAAPPPVDNPSEQGQLQAFYNQWVANGGDGTMAGFLAHYRAVNGVDLTPAQVALVFDPTGAAWPQSNGPGNGPGNGPAVVTPPPAATTTTTIRPWNVIQKPGEPFNIANFHDDEIRWYFYWGTQEEQNRAMQSTLQALGVNTANNNQWAKSLSTYVPSMAEQLTAQQLYNGGLLNPEGTAVTPLQLENSLLC